MDSELEQALTRETKSLRSLVAALQEFVTALQEQVRLEQARSASLEKIVQLEREKSTLLNTHLTELRVERHPPAWSLSNSRIGYIFVTILMILLLLAMIFLIT